MYHYKAPHDGCTRHSVNGLKYIDKIGKLISIEAYTVGAYTAATNLDGDHWIDNKIRIIVKGEKGSCTYGGFLWSYGGEGPHGLVDLFIKCGMPCILAENYALLDTLGPNDANEKNTKLYQATTLWKFMNSPIGWNRINIEKQVPKFKKGQKLNFNYNGKPYKCTFVKYKANSDKAYVTYDIPLINLYGIEDLITVNSLTPH